MKPDLWSFEKKAIKNGFSRIAGIDEAGRGPLAGPVVAAAVILPLSLQVSDIGDSKKLSTKKRIDLYERIYEHAVAIGVGIIDAIEIDRINILKASLLAMAISVENLSKTFGTLGLRCLDPPPRHHHRLCRRSRCG